MTATIQPIATFKDNLQQLPAIDGVQRVDLFDDAGAVVASIENAPGKQGSLAVYQYLKQAFGLLDALAAAHGLEVFGEHTADARERPGAHPARRCGSRSSPASDGSRIACSRQRIGVPPVTA
jgi:hypothetical protein